MTDSALNAFVWRGTHSARLSLTPSPPLSSSGYFAFETDTLNTYSWDGSAWQQVNTAGAMTLVSHTSTTSSAANVTVSGIAGGRNLKIVINSRGDTAATTTVLKLQLNTDTGSNYDYQYVAGIGAAASAANAFAGSFMLLGDIPAATATAGRSSAIAVEIPNYGTTTFDKQLSSSSYATWGTSGSTMESILLGGTWRSTAAITAIKIFPAAGNFVDGTTVDVYTY